MKSEIQKLWADALESGEYKQGTGSLALRDGTYCCLGVLCDLAAKAGVIEPPVVNEYGSIMFVGGNTNYLPKKVQEWTGLTERDPYLGMPYTLAQYNDGTHHLPKHLGGKIATFADIAQIIRGYKKGDE